MEVNSVKPGAGAFFIFARSLEEFQSCMSTSCRLLLVDVSPCGQMQLE